MGAWKHRCYDRLKIKLASAEIDPMSRGDGKKILLIFNPLKLRMKRGLVNLQEHWRRSQSYRSKTIACGASRIRRGVRGRRDHEVQAADVAINVEAEVGLGNRRVDRRLGQRKAETVGALLDDLEACSCT